MVFPFLRIHSIRGRDFTACVHESEQKKFGVPFWAPSSEYENNFLF